jgi:hypothetical protein
LLNISSNMIYMFKTTWSTSLACWSYMRFSKIVGSFVDNLRIMPFRAIMIFLFMYLELVYLCPWFHLLLGAHSLVSIIFRIYKANTMLMELLVYI